MVIAVSVAQSSHGVSGFSVERKQRLPRRRIRTPVPLGDRRSGRNRRLAVAAPEAPGYCRSGVRPGKGPRSSATGIGTPREVALPSTASYCCRTGVNVVFMAAFGIPITVFTVLLVASSHTLSQIFAITPGGVGQTQALDVATLSRYGSSAAA